MELLNIAGVMSLLGFKRDATVSFLTKTNVPWYQPTGSGRKYYKRDEVLARVDSTRWAEKGTPVAQTTGGRKRNVYMYDNK